MSCDGDWFGLVKRLVDAIEVCDYGVALVEPTALPPERRLDVPQAGAFIVGMHVKDNADALRKLTCLLEEGYLTGAEIRRLKPAEEVDTAGIHGKRVKLLLFRRAQLHPRSHNGVHLV